MTILSLRTRALPIWVLALALSCGGNNPQPGKPNPPSNLKRYNPPKNAPDGLDFTLGHGGGSTGSAKASIAQAQTTPLSQTDTEKLLARMPAIKVDPSDKKAFALRPASKPAPRTGNTVSVAFPPPTRGPVAPKVSKGPLEILRHSPEGDVPMAPHLSITFSQPMVAITSHKDTIATIPVQLTPKVEGRWRWVGARTLLFDPSVRLPMATAFTAVVPAGTASQNAGKLAKEVRWQFRTPAPTLVRSFPGGRAEPLDAVMYAEFDQDIDPQAVLAKIKLTAGGTPIAVRAATASEIAESYDVKNAVEAAKKAEHDKRFVTFVPTLELPNDAAIRVEIAKGTPSAEGPRTTDKPQTFGFRTYGPFKVMRSRCAWGGKCRPESQWQIELSNPIDQDKFDAASVQITPAPPSKGVIQAHGRYIYFRGRKAPNTQYSVQLPGALTDKFGQTLGSSKPLLFNVGESAPRLFGAGGLVVADPYSKKPSYSVFSVGHKELKVKIQRVMPSDWLAYSRYMYNSHNRSGPLPGKTVFDQKVTVSGKPEDLSETTIDLAKALNTNKRGHAIVFVEPVSWPHKWTPPRAIAWVQVTNIGLDVAADGDILQTWTNDLETGAPKAGVSLSILSRGKPFSPTATSGTDGIAKLALTDAPKKRRGQAQILLAQSGDDSAFVTQAEYIWSDYGGWHKRKDKNRLGWFVFDDRKLYKPGEKVHVKGWLRQIDFGKGGDTRGYANATGALSYVVKGPRNNKLTEGSVPVNAAGGFNLEFKLPTTPNLGWARIEFNAIGTKLGRSSHHHRFQIQEFRRPEFEVQTKSLTSTHFVGQASEVSVKAKYYAGGALPNAPVNWRVSANPGSYRPPGHDKWTFGRFVPWWTYWHDRKARSTNKTFTAKTDGSGKHALAIDYLSVKPARPMSVTASASVTDVNRQRWSSSTSMLVHPAALYVGLKSERLFVKQGQPIEVDTLVVDLDGKVATGTDIELKAARIDWKYKNGRYQEIEVDEQSCLRNSATKTKPCSFTTKEGGRYKVLGIIHDAQGRRNESELSIWVSGGKRPPARKVEQEKITLIPDKKDYQPGETARILVQAPFSPAEGVLTLRRSGIVTTRRFTITGTSTTLEVPIKAGHMPNVYAHIDLVGAATRVGDEGKPLAGQPKRPAYAVGAINLPVPPTQRKLDVQVKPHARKLEPGGKTKLRVHVKDASKRPIAGAELAVVVVDEAVLALSGYKLGNILNTFHPSRGTDTRDVHSRRFIELAQELQNTPAVSSTDQDGDERENNEGRMGKATADRALATEAPAEPMAATPAPGKTARPRIQATGGAIKPAPIAVRKDFNALAVFAPSVTTGVDGSATISVKLPDNLTRYRVMVAAVAGANHFGQGESAITARMPLMVRPSAPRFLNFGDKFELPVVVQNQTDKEMHVSIAARASNAKLAKPGQRLVVGANDRVEVRFPAAADMPGRARFQIAATASQWTDAAEVDLPVWTPATTEAFATYGVIDKGAVSQPVAMPGGVVKEFGGLDLTTSSTQLQALTDALLYLVDYRFECAEQISSRVVAVAALRDVLTAFEADGLPSPKRLRAAVERDIKKLQAMQNADGGFAFWQRGYPSWPYLSIHVAHSLQRAKDKGYGVPASMLAKSQRYLRKIESHYPHYYGKELRNTLTAYALYTRKLMGDADLARARKLVNDDGGIKARSLEAAGWLLSTLARDRGSKSERKKIYRHLVNKVSETAAAANFNTSYSDGGHLILHSSRRADAIILDALIKDRPKSDLIVKVVRGLLAHRKRGRWSNTQENAFVLLAMDQYFQKYEKVTPNFVATAWLGDQFAGQQRFRGRSTQRNNVHVSMMDIAKIKRADLVLQKQGRGRLYYRLGMKYAPQDLKLAASDHGFAVTRAYEAVDDPQDVKRRADGTWEIKAGATVRVRVTMVAENRRYHVALVDPIPAGLEPMNPALATTGPIPQDKSKANDRRGRYWWWQRAWYEHQNMRDERVEAFASSLWAGVHEYVYTARATTPGNFVVPPAKAEEMYHPETFGRSASARVVIK